MIDQDKLVWRKSSRSGPWTDNCVEVALPDNGGALVRDTKDKGNGPVLTFTASEWDAFVLGAKDGEFDSAA